MARAFQGGAFQFGAFQLLVAGVGGAGAATFAMSFEDGARVVYSWQTDILKMSSGLEQRAASRSKPRQRYEFSTLLSDAQHRRVLSTLAGAAAGAPLWLLGLTYEATTVASSTSSSIVTDGLSFADWAADGQRIVVVSPAGVQGEAVVQSAAGATLTVDQDLTAVATRGALVMPAVPVYLDADQAFSRYAVNAGTWALTARAQLNGFAGGAVGTGATLTMFDSLPLWDLGIALEQASQPMHAGYETADLGGQISTLAAYGVVDWSREIAIESSNHADWQWFRLFLDTIQGQRGAFLLPSGRPDLVPIGDASSGTLTVEGPPATDAVDYAGDWFPSLAHRRLKIVLTDGTVAYRSVASCAAGTGTQDLALNAALAGAIDRVEFLELCRLRGDEVSVTWRGWAFESTIAAMVVQG